MTKDNENEKREEEKRENGICVYMQGMYFFKDFLRYVDVNGDGIKNYNTFRRNKCGVLEKNVNSVALVHV